MTGVDPNRVPPPAPTSNFAVVVPVPAERSPLARYSLAVAATVLALGASMVAEPYIQRVIFVLFWPAVIGAAWFGGIGPAVLSSALSVFLADYFIMSPGDLTPGSPDDLIPFAVFLFASSSVAVLTNAARVARRSAAQAAVQNAELAHEIELQTVELEQQLEESQAMSEELEQTTEELSDRTAAAEAAELFTSGVLESIAHPFVVYDADWRFRYLNEAAAAVFQRTPLAPNESVIGRTLWEVYPDIIGTDFEREMRRAASERKLITFEAYYAGLGQWNSVSCFPLADGGLSVQWSDITARKRAEETEHYLGRASQVLASSLDYETTLDRLARLVVPQLADWCGVTIVDEHGVPQQVAVAHVDPEKVAWARELNRRYPLRMDAATGLPNVLRTGRAELYPEVTDAMIVASSVDDEHLRLSREIGMRSAIIVPLVGSDRPIGAMTLVAAESGRRYTEQDLPFATELARRAAVAVEHARLHREAVHAREAAEQVARVADRLYSLTARLAAANTEQEVARIVVANLREVLAPKAVAIFRLDYDETGAATLVMMDESGVNASNRARFGRIALDSAIPIAEVTRERQSVFISDAATFEARFPHWPSETRAAGREAWICRSLVASTGSPLGAFTLGFDHARTFEPDMRRLIDTIGDQATQAFERVRLLATEHTAREAAEEANRAKTQFLATMSHELRTPLNAISGYAELLSLGLRGPTTPEQQQDLGRIMRSQRHLLSVINDILNFARLEAGHVEYRLIDVAVSDIIGDLESLIRPQLEAKELDFSCTPVSDGVVVRADAEKVRQILLNLLANAVKFTSPGGRIRVECVHDDEQVSVRVSDTGIGIPADRRGAIFEPFVQLHRTLAHPAEGTGLGLAISRDLARGMGGELTVESEPGHGSTFTLVLPRVDASVVAAD